MSSADHPSTDSGGLALAGPVVPPTTGNPCGLTPFAAGPLATQSVAGGKGA